MLTEIELILMRAEANKSLVDSCVIKRPSVSDDGLGGKSKSDTTIGTVACRVGPTGRQPEERVIASRLTEKMPYTLTFPAGTNVQAGDIALIGTRQFSVEGVAARTYEIVRRCVCTEVEL